MIRDQTFLKAFNKCWMREGPGIPSNGIFEDNDGEFMNAAMLEVEAKYSLDVKLTAANSPWSNEKNERNQYTCDLAVDKLLEEDPSLLLDDEVSHAVNAKNLQITRQR